MTKKYYAVSGPYGFGFFDNWNAASRGRDYVGRSKYVKGFANPQEAVLAAYSAFHEYNYSVSYKLMNPVFLTANKLYFRKNLLMPGDYE